MVTIEYAVESVRVLFHWYRFLNMRYGVKKSQDKIRTEEL